MNVVDLGGEVKISDVPDFDLAKIFECGQCFRWEADVSRHCEFPAAQTGACDRSNPEKPCKYAYTGVAYGRAAAIRTCGNPNGGDIFISGTIEDFESLWRGYFDLDRDYAKIREQLCVSDFMRRATQFGAGIRILRQEPWEALCTFILSQNNHIPRIKKIVSALCGEFGDSVDFRGKTLYTFPFADRLAGFREADLSPLRCGYRARYIIEAAKAIADGAFDLETLGSHSAEKARAELKRLCGVGDKVANCVLLFGLHMLDSFPVDVWIRRALDEHCGADFDPKHFFPYAGIAQQYIYHYARNGK